MGVGVTVAVAVERSGVAVGWCVGVGRATAAACPIGGISHMAVPSTDTTMRAAPLRPLHLLIS